MADTTTPNLDLLLMQVGAPSREIVVNNGLMVLDTLTSSVLSLDLAGSGDYVLTDTIQGEAKHGCLRLTGVLTGARTLLVPAKGRQYLIYNGTTGSQTLTVTTADGGGVTVDEDTWALLVCDGTDVLATLTGGSGSGPLPTASETQAGIVELATAAETLTGTETTRAVHPAGLQAKIDALPGAVPATETQAGVVELATSAEVLTGTDTTRAVTPAGLQAKVNALPTATTTAGGLIELATASEVTTGTDAQRAITPATLVSRQATETLTGLVELATPSETTTGTDATRAVTPAGLAAKVPAGTPLSVTRYASSGPTVEAAAGVLTTANPGQLVLGSNQSGLGAGTPLIIERDGGLNISATYGGVSGGVASAGLSLRGARNSVGTPQALQSQDPIGNVGFAGYQGSAYSGNMVVLRAHAEEPWTPTTLGCSLRVETVAVGSSTRAERVRIDGQGHLTTWSGGKTGLGTPLTATLGSGASYPALSVAGSLLTVGQSSVQERPQSLLSSTWVVSTDATRTARLTVSAYDATAAREGLRVEADGSAARLGFYGANAVVKPTVSGSRGGNAALASALTALASLGLMTDNSTT